jgi:2-polyprenyl-6-methoxyphenol hydroxylase-like FAD-dependent oxidoreductase
MMKTDVLIVGAGPTGLMLANQLGRRGLRPIIIDRHSGPAMQTRAMAVHARTLEIYRKLGISDAAVELGQVSNGANMWVGGRKKARIPFEEMGRDQSAFPYVLMLGQDDNERLLGAHLRRWDIEVQWNTELLALEQHSDHVVATVRDAAGATRRILASYVAGCDGGRSAVREMNGIGFPGAPYQHTFFVADTVATGAMVPAELNVYLWRDGFHLFFPMRGANRWRVIGILPEPLRDRSGVEFEDVRPSLVREAGADLSFQSCDWFSTYRIQHRCTEKFRDRRCFLLGDAAHVHSPMGGQGMNTGLQDAYNLAWKLSLVVAGRADERLLDSYEAERMPVAHRLLETTDRAFRLVVSDGWLAGQFRMRVMPTVAAAAMRRPGVRRRAFQTLSQLGIGYPKSPLSGGTDAPAEGPAAGQRFPWMHLAFRRGAPRQDLFEVLDDLRFNLLVVGQPVPDARSLGMDDLLRIHPVPLEGENVATLAEASITGPAYYLLRPDGHVGLAGGRLDEAAVRQWFADAGLRGSRSAHAPAARPLAAPTLALRAERKAS